MWDYSKLDEELDSILDIDMSMFNFENIEETNLDDFFEESEEKEKEKKTMICPHCGKEIEL